MSEAVNPQITDAVSQANAAILGGAPSVAMGSFLQSAEQSTSIAMRNAVTAQQQSFVTAQAVATMGASKILNADATADAVAADLSKARARLADVVKQHEGEAMKVLDVAVPAGGISDASPLVEAFAASLDRLGDSTYRGLLHVLQLAATAAALEGLVRSPDKVEQYERVLEVVRKLA